jgi:hypothetical protein
MARTRSPRNVRNESKLTSVFCGWCAEGEQSRLSFPALVVLFASPRLEGSNVRLSFVCHFLEHSLSVGIVDHSREAAALSHSVSSLIN